MWLTSNLTLDQPPQQLRPYHDPELIQKLEVTLRKTAAYLSKVNVASWWESWLHQAWQWTFSSEPQVSEGR